MDDRGRWWPNERLGRQGIVGANERKDRLTPAPTSGGYRVGLDSLDIFCGCDEQRYRAHANAKRRRQSPSGVELMFNDGCLLWLGMIVGHENIFRLSVEARAEPSRTGIH